MWQKLSTQVWLKVKGTIFILLLWKGVYPCGYMDNLETFIETSWPEKENFYSHLNIDDITDADCMHVKRVCKDFEIK